MGNKKKRQERMTRIPASQMTVSEPQFRHRELAVKTDGGGRIRPVKPRNQAKRIDGAVATIMGDKALSLTPVKPVSVYASRGALIINRVRR